MRNFNNIRTIDLKEYLPDVLKDVQEMRAIMEAETPEVQAIWDACEDCMNDQFISEATENGVARREKMLGITPFATDTLDDRKLRLLSRYNENIPYTRKSLAALLESLCGAGGYILTITTATFTVNVKVALGVKKQETIISETLERILQKMQKEHSIEKVGAARATRYQRVFITRGLRSSPISGARSSCSRGKT